ncbi:MAG: asparagine synthase [Candidatus Aminicenantes bacterium]|nr:asparagine synthase [Candidatus Aminicenantes bacterium]
MAGIAGIEGPGARALVESMLDAVAHRGPDGRSVHAGDGFAFGMIALTAGPNAAAEPLNRKGTTVVWDGELYNFQELQAASGFEAVSDEDLILRLYTEEGAGFLGRLNGPFALAIRDGDRTVLARDPMGQAPLYWGALDGRICFASEMKSLQKATEDINAFPPGYVFDGELRRIEIDAGEPAVPEHPDAAAAGLLRLLERAVEIRSAGGRPLGSWLSGGLDSATMAALASRYRSPLLTFSAGMEGAPDLSFARKTAAYLGTEHHEVLYGLEDMLRVLPRVIYHLESFDAPLVRSSVANFLVAELASKHVRSVLSGEGGDELFAGYSYLKSLSGEEMPAALSDAQKALSNTALQRVDRMAAAHGTRARTCFLDPEVAAYANAVPAKWKIHGEGKVEKWILRQALEGRLPEEIRMRPKEKFWSGSGIEGKLAEVAESQIGDDAFAAEKKIAPGLLLTSKEDLFYYRIFRGFFPSPKAVQALGVTLHRQGN